MSAPAILAQAAVPRGTTVTEWLGDPATWTGPNGILASLGDTVTLCLAVIATAALIALPTAAVLAHLRRAELASAWLVNIGRAVPTLAIAAFLVPVSLRNGFGLEPWPIFVALTVMTLPPLYLSTYVAIKQVDPAAVDAARAMGFSGRAVLLTVELPLALTVIFTGLRVGAVQVVATEPIRAFIGGDGLGRYVRDGIGQNNDTLTIGGTILIAALAGATAIFFTVVERLVKPSGVRRMRAGTGSRPMESTDEDAQVHDGAGRDGGVDAVAGRLR